MALFAMLVRLFVAATIISGTSAGWLSAFKDRLSSISNAHDALFHERLLGQLRSVRASSTATVASQATSVAITSHLSELDTTPDNSTGSYADNSTDTFVLYTSDALPTNPAPPAACAEALTATIDCNSTVPLMSSYDYLFQSIADLAPVCTSGCTTALAGYRAAVATSCDGFTFIDSSNSTYPATYVIDTVLGAYNLQCLYDSSDAEYCGPVVNSYNATGGLLSLPTNELCSFCTLETLNLTLSNPTTFSYPLQELLSEAVQECGSAYDSYNVTGVPNGVVAPAATASFGVTGTPPGSISCSYTGKNVTVTSDTTCAALSAQYQVSTNDIRSNNPGLVDGSCSIAAPATLCVPPACTLYTVKTNDTCTSVAAASLQLTGFNLTTIQLTSINPELGTYCQSMPALVGDTICLSPNGGWPSVGATSTAQPSPSPTAVAPVPTPTGPGSTANCGIWYLTKEGDYCNSVILANGITLADFLLINPEINANCTNLWLGYYYCVAPYPPLISTSAMPTPTSNYSTGVINMNPVPTANYTPIWYTSTFDPVGAAVPTNVANGTRNIECGYYYDVESGDTIDSIASDVGINASVLETWNPQLESSAPVAGTSLCVVFPTGNYTLYNATRPSNADPKSTPDCAEWYTVVAGDGCASIEDEFGLTSSQFLQMNPGVGSDCTTLQLGVSYCVLSIYPPSASSGPPGNLAPGSFSNCTSYATVQSGNTCTTLETDAGVSFTDLLRWNPELNVDCENLDLGAAYCVAGGGDACLQLYTVQSGDYCGLIETNEGITAAQLQQDNPWLDSNCDLQVGQVLCVAASGPTQTTTVVSTTTSATTTTTSAGATPTYIASGSWTNCTAYYTVQSGDSCTAIDQQYDIALSDFLRWNPEVLSSCSNLQLAAYCVGSSPACSKVYTVVSGDYCSEIESANGISDAQLHALNPWIDSACDLQVGQNLCVG